MNWSRPTVFKTVPLWPVLERWQQPRSASSERTRRACRVTVPYPRGQKPATGSTVAPRESHKRTQAHTAFAPGNVKIHPLNITLGDVQLSRHTGDSVKAKDRGFLSSVWTWEGTSSLWGWRSTGTGCPGRLWSLLLWRYSRPAWTRSCATYCMWPCFGRGVGLDDPQRSLPTPNILWYHKYFLTEAVLLGRARLPTVFRVPVTNSNFILLNGELVVT